MQLTYNAKAKILVVDDEPNNLQVINQVLVGNYQLVFAKNGQRAIEIAIEQQPDLILLDIMMPEMDGYEVCRTLKKIKSTAHIPIIFVSAMSNMENECQGFEAGGVDYITKPICPEIVRVRVKTHLSLVGVNELKESRMQIIQRLGRAAEYKDNETGLHVIRMSHYSKLIARAAGLDEFSQETLLNAAPMHDIGKIGIPDHILLKPGKLDAKEWAIMKTHANIGADIIGENDSPLLSMALSIALTHHEKWDGSGYPNHLKGQEIPLVGRIVAIADVFDALTSERSYKAAWPVDKAIAHMNSVSGSHFDPDLIKLFNAVLPDILLIRNKWPELKASSSFINKVS
ncbi:two-component system response regulator [Colwellia sp. BRX8-2]|uniref:response regulator n=3 Tax=Colwellia TaxID=28228 RepID=UPI0015F732B2|nr:MULTISPECIES: two-component system response regulator [unclassified Colwellia]MBA6364408.1 two-component system response regulator [Colwellia sp. BRX8-8]MBA6352982.1 two-component system response regulator [Colwellia sp. BRX9-1]MBA6359263.1 two-component system response regulator [Colwellia sp. BRX8-6]MBA6368086.1 two-component system response regulator [Colwellia sp. BRX8-5]MBA6372034.1 two-component system response regulator [Colwellia sp. BRX8-4]